MEDEKTKYYNSDNLNLKALIALSRCAQHVHKLEYRTIKEGGLTVSQFAVLEVLYHKGDLRVCEILEKILATGGNMTVVIDNLVKENLVMRTIDPTDKRVNLIRLTDKGQDLISSIFPSHAKNIDDIFNILTEDEKKQLINILKKLSGV
ncbi:MAG: MarR family transcriptional regulator [Anaerocolumna sp.]|jgi:DNA-binding MarR family transcriptional regulator|nr:MarR family transcriptional regulator [Anaerocolumna sp.]